MYPTLRGEKEFNSIFHHISSWRVCMWMRSLIPGYTYLGRYLPYIFITEKKKKKNITLSKRSAHHHHKTTKSWNLGRQAKLSGLIRLLLPWILPTLPIMFFPASPQWVGDLLILLLALLKQSPFPLTTPRNSPAAPLTSVSAQVPLAGNRSYFKKKRGWVWNALL